MTKKLLFGLLTAVLLTVQGLIGQVSAEDQDKFSKAQLDQMLAPIALYPDDILTNILMASTYPLDVVEAERWLEEPENAKLKGDELTKALEAKDWDPSIKALVLVPSVLKNMSEKLDWTQKLGDAFLAQQDDVMDQIQFLRQKADESGNLKSNKQQTVEKESGGGGGGPVYVIRQADPDVVYVPSYQPTVVYGPWWYDDYPPYYWGYPDAEYVDGWWWGTGLAVGVGIWGWNHFDWHRHDIDIDVNKWNNINHNRNKITNNTWQHRPDHRGPVPYSSKEVRDKFAKGDRGPGSKDELRGRDIDRSKVESRLKPGDRANQGDRNQIKDKVGKGGSAARDRGGNHAKSKAGSAQKAVNRQAKGSQNKARNTARSSSRKPSSASKANRASNARQVSNRGNVSRVSKASNRGGSMRGGGMRMRGGGGGMRGGRGGGRR